jgi:NADH-quinone oxidoreductase subunit M
VLGTTGIVFAAVYLLWMYQRVVFGEVRHEETRRLSDLNAGRSGRWSRSSS